jgi:formylglycine-generating enzyme required for sulfatase activity
LQVTLVAGQRLTVDMAQFNMSPSKPDVAQPNMSDNEAALAAPAEEGSSSRAQSGPKDMVEISEGEFVSGCSRRDRNCNTNYVPARRRVPAYRIDRQEVTVRDYRRCVQAGRCAAPAASYSYCNWVSDDAEDHPINCVTWDQADAYCGWAGKRLPASLEWEKAARGTDARPYPWGKRTPSCFRAVGGIGGKYGCGSEATAPVCSKSAGNTPSGLCDMAGNVWEWVADDLDKSARSGWLKSVRRGRRRMQRGGSWRSTDIAAFHTTAMRLSNSSDASVETGFRCAMDVE